MRYASQFLSWEEAALLSLRAAVTRRIDVGLGLRTNACPLRASGFVLKAASL